jgi:hypothetical protein
VEEDMSRPPSKLSETLHRQLNSYALAASAAGVGALALAQPAEAKVIYTPTHVKIASKHFYLLDLTHNGKAEFMLSNIISATNIYGHSWYGLFLRNEGQESCSLASSPDRDFAAALPKGARVGSKDFVCGGGDMVIGSSEGQWENVTGRYLGLKFYMGKKPHYGWARLNVTVAPLHVVTAVLTGYAYETIPNKPIIAGKTKGPDVITLEPGSLGALAAGMRLRR